MDFLQGSDGIEVLVANEAATSIGWSVTGGESGSDRINGYQCEGENNSGSNRVIDGPPDQNLQAIWDAINMINRLMNNLWQKAIKFREFPFSVKPDEDIWCEN